MVEISGELSELTSIDINRIYQSVAKRFSLPKSCKINLNIVNEQEIRELNKSTRNIDKVTDVLSYPYTNILPNQKLKLKDYKLEIDPYDKSLTIGDIYICMEKAVSQSKEYNHTLNREICFLFCHGLLHVLGYDHMEESDAKIMENLQVEILDNLNISRDIFKCGFVTILGETNVGKSTLINQLVGEKIAIVSPKSQTTRENIKGIYNDNYTQIVFVDTPGLHKRNFKIDEEMEKQIQNAQEDTEIILMIISAKQSLVEQYNKLIKQVKNNAKKILLINKIDETKYEKLYPQLLELSKITNVDEILPISAKSGKNCDVVLNLIKNYLPSYDHEVRYYPINEYTDKNLRHMVAEIIREKALLLLDDEIPHGIQVMVVNYQETSPIKIDAELYCEKENHKAIILGKNGEMIKKISTMARTSIEKLVGDKVFLEVFVKVKPNWRNDYKAISNFGLNFSE